MDTKKNPIISSPMMGALIFIFVESMFFASFISAYFIVRSGAINWPPFGQPRLPIVTTAFNTLVLLVSGVLLLWSYRLFLHQGLKEKVKKLFLAALGLGILFFCIQGYEWIRLIGFGLTMKSSVYGSFFYLIIGFHGLHVLAVTTLLGMMYKKLTKQGIFSAVLALWLFVVGVWPGLYYLVYLK